MLCHVSVPEQSVSLVRLTLWVSTEALCVVSLLRSVFQSIFFSLPVPLCVLQQFCGVLGHTFMEFLKGSGDYCQAQHAAYADEWTAKLAIDPKHLSHRRDPGKLAGPGRLPEPARTRPGWGNSTRCTLPSSASAWPESRWNQPCFFFLPFL